MLIALDPGTDKFGWALSSDSGDLLLSGLSAVGELEAWAGAVLRGDLFYLEERALEKAPGEDGRNFPDFVIVGSGTGSAGCIKKLVSSGLRVEKVSEEFSTERGRELYWLIHPPRGLRRLLPKGLLVPPRTIDDLAAWSLILQYLGRGRDHFRV